MIIKRYEGDWISIETDTTELLITLEKNKCSWYVDISYVDGMDGGTLVIDAPDEMKIERV